MRWILITALAVVLIYGLRPAYLLIWSSSPNEAQYKCDREGKPDDPRIVPRPTSGVVKVIRLNDLGEFVQRCEFTDALYELNWDRERHSLYDFNVAIKPGAVPLPKFVVLYLHGWRNDAREIEGDLPKFRELIKHLADANIGKQVTGIYVSWEAASEIPVWESLTFWNRMRAADRIAQSGIVTRIVGAIGGIINASKRGGQFVAIGHSFGARILLSSTLQSTISDVQKAHPGAPNSVYKVIRSEAAQTIVLLNPAFEASLFTTLNALDREEERFSPDQNPVIVSISTNNDWATKYAFPAGQWLGWWTAEKEIRTLGNYPLFETHRLLRAPHNDCNLAHPGSVKLTERFQETDVCLKRVAGFPHNPFMVVGTTSEILSGHSGIWDDDFSRWLFRYIDALGSQLADK